MNLFYMIMELIQIKELVEFDAQVVPAIQRLLDQLVSSPIEFTEETLCKIIDSPSSHLFLLYSGKEIAGMCTLGTYSSPTGTKYWVEDVVVDQAYRGQALGRRLIEYAMEYVGQQGKSTLMLTSRPSRMAANRLYQSVGFQPKQTNVYTMDFPDEESSK